MENFSEGFDRLTKSEEFVVFKDDLKVYQQTEHVNKISIVKNRRQIRRKTFLGTSALFNPYKDKERLFAAVNRHNVEAAESLLKGGVPANCYDNKMRTPLHIATAGSDELVVKLLLQHGADPNKKDVMGSTCLHLAACNCNIPIVTQLLWHGANVKISDGNGRNPVDLSIGRLKCLRESKTYSSDRLKHQISLVVSLMQAINEEGMPNMCDALDGINNQLEVAEKPEEIDAVGQLLDDLTNLHINKTSQ